MKQSSEISILANEQTVVTRVTGLVHQNINEDSKRLKVEYLGDEIGTVNLVVDQASSAKELAKECHGDTTRDCQRTIPSLLRPKSTCHIERQDLSTLVRGHLAETLLRQSLKSTKAGSKQSAG